MRKLAVILLFAFVLSISFATMTEASDEVTWKVLPNLATGKAKKISGCKTEPLIGADNESAARKAIAFFKSDLGLKDSGSDLEYFYEKESFMGKHVAFKQKYKGLPVFNSAVFVHLDKRNRAFQVDSKYIPEIKVDITPKISVEEAMAAVQKVLEINSYSNIPTESVLGIYHNNGNPKLAWRITIYSEDPVGKWESTVDANSAKVVLVRNLSWFVDGSGRVFDPNPQTVLRRTDLVDQNDSDDAVPAGAYSTVTLANLTGNGTLTGSFCTTEGTPNRANEANNVFNYSRNNDKFEEVMVYYHITTAQQYIQSLGMNNVNNRSVQCFVNSQTPGTSFTDDQSYYQPDGSGTGCLNFGSGGVDDGEDADIILHEYGHSIQDNQVIGFGSSYEGRAMGEGFSDYWAATNHAEFNFYNTLIGIWDAVSYNSDNPPRLRSIESSKVYPDDMTNADYYADSAIWSSMLWGLRETLGAEVADTLVLQAHFLQTPNSEYCDAAETIITADNNIYDGAHVSQIETVLDSKGLLDCGSSTPVELNKWIARPVKNGILLQWSTLSETDCYGWNIMRRCSPSEAPVKINKKVIPGFGTTHDSHNYKFLDEDVKKDKVYFYRLDEVTLDGSKIKLPEIKAITY